MSSRDWQMRHRRVCQSRREKLYTSGAAKLTHFVYIRQLTSERGSRNLASGMSTPISPAWPPEPLSGSGNSSLSITALLFTPTTFSFRPNLRSGYPKSFRRLVPLSRSAILLRISCGNAFPKTLGGCTGSIMELIAPNLSQHNSNERR